MESRKILMNLFARQKYRCRHMKRLWTQGGKERVEQIKRVALKHALPHVKQIANEKLIYNTGSSTGAL